MKTRISKYFILMFVMILSILTLLQTPKKVSAVEMADSFEHGSGTISDPYQIKDESEFLLFKNDPSFTNSHFILVSDIIVTSQLGDGTNNTINMFNTFGGSFNGNSFTITYLASNEVIGNNFGGIAGTITTNYTTKNDNCTDETGSISNVNVKGTFNVVGDNVGGLVGEVKTISAPTDVYYESLTLKANTFNTVSFDGNLDVTGSNVGGIAGALIEPSFIITNNDIQNLNINHQNVFLNVKVLSTSLIKGGNYVGGIVGRIVCEELNDTLELLGTINNLEYKAPNIECLETGRVAGKEIKIDNVSQSKYVGGIVGCYDRLAVYDTRVLVEKTITDAKITYTNNEIEVLNGKQYVGGIAGYFGGREIDINDDLNIKITTDIAGATNVGGVFAVISDEAYNTLFEEELKFKAVITTNAKVVGGFISQVNDFAKVKNISANVSITSTGNTVGGLVGRLGSKHGAQIDNCSVYGDIKAGSYVGGLAGDVLVSALPSGQYHISNSTTYCDVIGGSSVGGVVGSFSNGLDALNCQIYNTWMAGTVDIDLDITKKVGSLDSNYVYWGAFYGYQHKQYDPSNPTTVYLVNSGTILDVEVYGEHQDIDVFGVQYNLESNSVVTKTSETEISTTYQIKAIIGADLGIDDKVYGFIANYNGQVLRIKKSDDSFVYVTTMDRTQSKFNSDFTIDLDTLTSYDSSTDLDVLEEGENTIINVTNAKQLERLTFILNFFIPSDAGYEIAGPMDANVLIKLAGTNQTYDLTTSVGYYGDNNFYGFGWGSFGPFMGDFDGNNNTIILDMKFEDGLAVGLCGAVSSNAGGLNAVASENSIRNLKIKGTIVGGAQVGAVVGFHDNYAPATAFNYDRLSSVEIKNVTNYANVSGRYIVGGLIGYSHSSSTSAAPLELYPYFNDELKEEYASNIDNYYTVKGENNEDIIKEFSLKYVRVKIMSSTNYGEVYSTSDMGTGGLMGSTGILISSSAYISGCTSIGSVTSTGANVGGFLGRTHKAIITDGVNKVYCNVSGTKNVGLVYGYAPSSIGTYAPTYKPDLSNVTAYYYISLGDMDESILGTTILINGESFTFGNEHLYSDISTSDRNIYAINNANWHVSGVNTLTDTSLITDYISNYKGTYEKNPIDFEVQETTLGYILNIIKDIKYEASESTLNKVYDLEKDAYNEEWKLMATVTEYDDSTHLVEVDFNAPSEDSNLLEFNNITINDDYYNLVVNNITLTRITKEIVTYEKEFNSINELSSSEQYEKYLEVESLYSELITKYGDQNLILNKYLENKQITRSHLNIWKNIIVAGIEVQNVPSSITYGDPIRNYQIRYKTINGEYHSKTTEVVVSYDYSSNGTSQEVIIKYLHLASGASFYEVSESGLTASWELDELEILAVTDLIKRNLVFTINANQYSYDGNIHKANLTISNALPADNISAELTYNNSLVEGVIDAGTYSVSIDNITGENLEFYDYTIPTVNLVIKKAKVQVLYDSLEFVYNSEIQKPTLTVDAPSTVYSITSIDSINSGEYSITVKLTDTTNYEFENTTDDEITYNYEITKQTVSVSIPTIKYIKETSVSSKLQPTFTGLLEEVSYVDIIVRDSMNNIIDKDAKLSVGTYTVEYVFEDYVTNKITIEIVESIDINVPTLKSFPTTDVYSGIHHELDVVMIDDGYVLQKGTDYVIEYGGQELIEVGSYVYQIKGINTYSGSITKTYTITKASASFVGEANQEFTYNGTNDYVLSFSSTVGEVDVTYTYYDKLGSLLQTKPINAGEYKVIISAINSNNYDFAETLEINYTIKKANSIITTNDLEVTYDGQVHSVSATLNHYEAELNYVNNGQINAGTYLVTISASETLNYLATTETVTLKINKANSIITTSDLEVTYDGQVHIVSATLNHQETILQYQNNNKINAGAYNVIITASETANYLGAETKATLKINKANPICTNQTVSVYYLDTVRQAELKLPSGYYFVDNSGSFEECKTFEYDGQYIPTDLDNYNIVNIKITVNVLPKMPSFEVPTNLQMTYGNPLSSITNLLPEGFSFMDEDIIADSIGNMVFFLKYTPSDTTNYQIVENISVTIKVNKASQVLDKASVSVILKTLNEITINSIVNALYRINDGAWQTSNVFTGLTPDTTYTIEVKLSSNENYEESNVVTITEATLGKNEPAIGGLSNITYDYELGGVISLNHTSNSNGKITYRFADGSSRNVVTISNNTLIILNAGTAVIELYQEATDNYSSTTRSFIVTINKILPSVPTLPTIVATYGDTLNDLTLPTGFRFVSDLDTKVGNFGEREFDVIYTPSDLTNYLEVTGLKVTINVQKATPVVTPTLKNNDTLYAGGLLPELQLSLGDTEGTVSLDGSQTLKPGTNEYTYTFIPADKLNYKILTGTITLNVVDKVVDNIEVTNMPNKTVYTAFENFDKAGMIVVAHYNDGSTAEITNYEFKLDALLTSDSTFTISYQGKTTSISLTINKKTIDFTIVQNEFTYDGNSHSVIYSLPYSVSEVIGNVNLTEPTIKEEVTLTIVDDNYQGSISTTLVINKAIPNYTIPTNLIAVYNQTLADVVLPEGFSFVKELSTKVGNAGVNKFFVNYTPSDHVHYEAITNIEVEIKVNKATPEYEILTGLTAVYNSKLSTITLPSHYVFVNENDFVGNVGSNTHQVRFIPDDLANYEAVVFDVLVNVTKAKTNAPIVSIVELTNNSVRLTSLTNAMYRINGGEYQTSSYFSNLNSGETYVIDVYLIGDENHFDSDITTITVSLSEKTLPIITNFENINVTYSPSQKITLAANSTSAGLISYELSGHNGIATISGNIITIQNAGTFYVTLKQSATSTHTAYEKTIEVSVDKAIHYYELPTNLTATYNDLLSSVVLPAGFTFKENNPLSTVGNAGNNSFEVIYTPEDTNNYQVVSDIVSITVSKAASSVVVEYNGPTLFTTTSIVPVLTLVSSNTPGSVEFTDSLPLVYGTKNYSYKFTPDDLDNYKARTGYIKLTVLRPTLESLIINQNPTKLDYVAFDTVDLTGISVTAIYNDGITEKDLTIADLDVIYQNSETTLKASHTHFMISYETITLQINVNVSKKTLAFNNVVDEYTFNQTKHSVTYKLPVNGLEVRGIVSGTDACNKEYTLEIIDDNYQGKYSGTFVINKATPTNVTHPTLYGTYDQTKTLFDYVLNTGFTWVDPTIIPTVSTTTYQAIYNLDQNNYNDVLVNITLSLSKQELIFNNVIDNFVYDGLSHTVLYELDHHVKEVKGNVSSTDATNGISYFLTIVDDNYTGYIAGTLVVQKATPVVTITYNGGSIYPSTGSIILDVEGLAGVAKLDENQPFVVGTKKYSYTFVPTDIKNYNNYHGEIELTVDSIVLTSIEILTKPIKLEYTAFDEFNNYGAVIAANYNDSSQKVIYDYTYAAYVNCTEHKVVYEYTDGDVTKSVELSLNVSKRESTINPSYDTNVTYYTSSNLPVISLAVTDTKGKISFDAHQTLIAGENEYSYTFTPSDTNNYTIVTGKMQINVLAVIATLIDVITLPNKLIYTAFDNFDDSGMVVEVYYNDGSKHILEKQLYDVTASVLVNDPVVHVTYKELTDEFEIIVNKKAPVVDVTYDDVTLYTSSTIPTLTLLTTSTSGMVSWVNNTLVEGTYDYEYLFTPFDDVNYQSYTGKISLVVLKVESVYLSIDKKANKLDYVAFEEFSSSGMEVFLYYNDGSKEEVTNYEVEYQTTDGMFRYGDTLVKVNYAGYSIELMVNVVKASLVGLVEFNDETFVYDGNFHRLAITKLPDYVESSNIKYSNNNKITAGSYEVTATINALDYEVYSISAMLEITKRIINISFTGLTEGIYDTNEWINRIVYPQFTNIAGADSGNIDGIVTVGYSIDDQHVTSIKNVGKYKVEIDLTEIGNKNYILAHYEDAFFELTARNITLTPSETTSVYDGLTHTIKNFTNDENNLIFTSLDVLYLDSKGEIASPVDAGEYKVKLTSTDANYNIIDTNIVYTITPRILLLDLASNNSIYNGLVKDVELRLLNQISGDDIFVTYQIVKDNIESELVTAGIYSIIVKSIEGLDKDNYQLGTTEFEYTIDKLSVNVKIEDLYVTYDGLEHTPMYSVTLGSEGPAVNYDIEYYSGQTLLSSMPINAGTYEMVIVPTDLDNYAYDENELSHSFTITKRNYNITYPTDLTYDGNIHHIEVSFTNILESDLEYFDYYVDNENNKEVQEAKNYVIHVTSTSANYQTTDELTKVLVVNKLVVNLSLETLTNKVLYNKEVLGGLGLDEIYLVKSDYNGEYEIDYEVVFKYHQLVIDTEEVVNAGTYEINIIPEVNENVEYNVTNSINFVIDQIVLSADDSLAAYIKLMPKTVIYDRNIHYVDYEVVGIIPGDEVNITIDYRNLRGESIDIINAGDYLAVVTSVDNSNYRLSNEAISTTVTVNKRPIKVVALNYQSYYGDDLIANEALEYVIADDSYPIIEGDYVSGLLVNGGNKSAVGEYAIGINSEKPLYVYNGTTNSIDNNYCDISDQFVPGVYTVLPRQIKITLAEQEFVYNKQAPEIKFIYEFIEPSISLNENLNDVITFKFYNSSLEELKECVKVGEYFVKVLISSGYSIVNDGIAQTEIMLPFAIEKAQLDINLVSNESVYNNQAVKIGYVTDEIVNVVCNDIKYNNNSVSEIKNAGVYTLDLEIIDDNYYGTATLDYTVHRAKYRDITHNDFIETYYEGIKLSDFVLDEGFKYACDDEELFVKGSGRKFKVIYNLDSLNYEDFELEISITILKKEVADFEFASQTFVYDGLIHTLEINELPLGIESVEYTLNELTNVGAIEVTATFTTNDNYHMVEDKEATLEITPRLVKVTPESTSMIYYEEEPVINYSVTNLVEGDVPTGSLSREPGNNVGVYKVTLGDLSFGDNYEIEFVEEATLTINKREITITPKQINKTYLDQDPTLTYEVEGIVDNQKATGKLAREDGEDVGEYKITLGNLSFGDNYEIKFTEDVLLTIYPYVFDSISLKKKVFEYTGMECKITLISTQGYIPSNITYVVEGGQKIKDSGTYKLTIVSDTPNFEISDACKEHTVRVVERDVTDDIIQMSNKSVYNGQVPTDFIICDYEHIMTITRNGTVVEMINAGKYEITIEITESNLTGSATFTYTIEKARYDHQITTNDLTITAHSVSSNIENMLLNIDGVWSTSITKLEHDSEYVVEAYLKGDQNYRDSAVVKLNIVTPIDYEMMNDHITGVTEVTDANIEEVENLILFIDKDDANYSQDTLDKLAEVIDKVDEYYADKVEKLIKDISRRDKSSITRAYEEYQKLTDAQKAKVDNFEALEKAMNPNTTWWIYVVIGLVVVAGGIVTTLIIIKKKKTA